MRFSANEYYALANADCISVAKALGTQVDEGKQTTTKAVHIKHSGGLYIFPEKRIIGIIIQTAEGAFRLIW